MKSVFEDYGYFIVAVVIGIVLLVGIYDAGINKNAAKVPLEKQYNLTAEDIKNKELANRPIPNLKIEGNMYILKNSTFNPRDYITKAVDADGVNYNTDAYYGTNLKIYSEVDTSKEGKYKVRYVLTDSKGVMAVKIAIFEVLGREHIG